MDFLLHAAYVTDVMGNLQLINRNLTPHLYIGDMTFMDTSEGIKNRLYRMMLFWFLIEKFVLKIGFEKRGILNKIPFLHKAFNGDFWKEISSFLSTSIILDR